MSDAQSATEDQFHLPDVLTDENITDKRRELLQLLHDHPRREPTWYASQIGSASNFLQVLRSRTDADVIDKIRDGESEYGGRKYIYELTDEARAALVREGVVEGDNIDQMEARSEEPSQRSEPGRVTVTGGPLDLTDGEGEVQLFKDRPAAKNAENGDHANGDGEVEEVSTTDADESPETITVELDPSDAFGLVHTADPKYARSLWRAVTETDE